MAKTTTDPKPATPAVVATPKNRASRSACNAVRAELVAKHAENKTPLAADAIKATTKPNDAKPGLRFNIIEACRASKTVAEAMTKQVLGKPGSKHDKDPYKVKMVDVIFCRTNGFITIG